MAFLPSYTRMLLDMHKQEPFTGTFLTIGRQTVVFNKQEAFEFLRKEGCDPRMPRVMFGDKTVAAQPGWIDDNTFFSMFCKAKIESLDVSKFEGATIIHDMNYPVPGKLCGIADFIFEGSCLDNIFSVGQAMVNIDKMLKPGGRLFMVNAGNIVPKDTFVAMGEEWYEGFLKANGYSEISVATFSYDKVDDDVWSPGWDGRNCCVVVKARKPSFRLRATRMPIQYGYAIQHNAARYEAARVVARQMDLGGRIVRRLLNGEWAWFFGHVRSRLIGR